MALFSRLETLSAMKRIGLTVVFYHPEADVGKRIVAACSEAGAGVIEFTNRGDRAAHVFSELDAYRRNERPDVILGVGSIIDAPTAALYINDGADFVVGPVLDEDTALLCNARKIPYCPGCGSATEIHRAHRLGVEICKVFPGAQVGGPAFIKAVRGPMPWAELMPTGGVDPTEESLSAWFGAGAACVGIGGNLIDARMVSQGRFEELAKRIRQTVELISRIRNSS
ncbi:MAG: bifunctional 4-hydroxy-2-oxoglutarate aldolase/2-dehydro-3-deoxy-phosphogluconate aldolase [Deltaproteobacteria bacterium]|nr:bifunctional 4-hydroxy-2-oxoglutarate aldolase/2-dehydro-3-deoxy-phosphogluconate aldolase [Candidatus Zymogenaceae bacterium]